VLDPEIGNKIVSIVETLRTDNVKTRWLRSDGTYVRRIPAENDPLICAHEALLEASRAI